MLAYRLNLSRNIDGSTTVNRCLLIRSIWQIKAVGRWHQKRPKSVQQKTSVTLKESNLLDTWRSYQFSTEVGDNILRHSTIDAGWFSNPPATSNGVYYAVAVTPEQSISMDRRGTSQFSPPRLTNLSKIENISSKCLPASKNRRCHQSPWKFRCCGLAHCNEFGDLLEDRKWFVKKLPKKKSIYLRPILVILVINF